LAGSVAERCGFEPSRPAPDTVRLRNCPFRPLADRAPEVVCAINREFLAGLLTGLDARGVEAKLAPQPGEGCVELRVLAEADSSAGRVPRPLAGRDPACSAEL
jgi:predicted ArsR family transcriptional regulator